MAFDRRVGEQSIVMSCLSSVDIEQLSFFLVISSISLCSISSQRQFLYRHKMITDTRLIAFLFKLFFVKSQISLYDTNDGIDIEFYDCVQIQSLFYCRRPKQPINLTRDNDTDECEHNDGQLHTFSELRSNNISVDILLHQWRSPLEQLIRTIFNLSQRIRWNRWISLSMSSSRIIWKEL